jgi:hypothetical protein
MASKHEILCCGNWHGHRVLAGYSGVALLQDTGIRLICMSRTCAGRVVPLRLVGAALDCLIQIT